MPEVRLVDLEVIKRYSLAIRQEHADAEELLDVLLADYEDLKKLVERSSRTRRTPASKSSKGSRASGRSKSAAGKKSGSRSRSGGGR